MNNDWLILGYFFTNTQLVIALLGGLSSICSFFFGIWFDKHNRENKLLYEMVQTFEDWIVTIQSMITIMYDDSSINRVNFKNSRNKGDFEEKIKSLAILDIKIEGLKRSKVLLRRDFGNNIHKIFSEISEIERLLSNEIIPLDCHLMRTRTDNIQYLDLSVDLRLALRKTTEKMENFQGLVYRAKLHFV